MDILKKTITTLPQTPGVYIYRDSENDILYVGKAKNLKKRVTQYTRKPKQLPEKVAIFVKKIASVETISTLTEFEALLLEAKLIRQYQPKYNSIEKDDKSPLYIAIENNSQLPHILLTRKPKTGDTTLYDYYGPFQSTRTTQQLLSSIRRIFPYCMQKQRTGRPCFYTHLGLCNPCPSVILKMTDENEKKKLIKKYRKNIMRIRLLLSGKSSEIVESLEQDMKKASKNEQFEKAETIQKQLLSLSRMFQMSFEPFSFTDDEPIGERTEKELKDLQSILAQYNLPIAYPKRIECYDVSHTSGKKATASMVVLTDGQANHGEYRRFSIQSPGQNDYAMLEEVITRRLHHEEWPVPELIIVDGGKGQVTAAITALSKTSYAIPVIGLSKREEHIIIPNALLFKTVRISLNRPGLHVLQRIRDEAHRFAITYHRLLRKKAFLTA